MTAVLERLAAAGVFAPIDVQLARTLGALDPQAGEPLLLGAAWASRAVGMGHVCADLRRVLARPLLDREGETLRDVRLPALFEWVMALGQGGSVVGDGTSPTPLVFDGDARLYLFRYFDYQRRLAEDLRRRARQQHAPAPDLGVLLEQLFAPVGGFVADPRQREAAAVASLRGLTVLSGGPGTGKTTTVVRMLALLQTLALRERGSPLRVALAAPTGKAAARMVEAIAASVAALPCAAAVKDALPRSATTIHRLLGFRPNAPTRFSHDADAPVLADVVLVDEASMIDLALLTKLVDAVRPDARVILVGDKHQLASVEAGAILGDICDASTRDDGGRSPELAQALAPAGFALDVDARAPAIADCLVDLVHNHRFRDEGGLGSLAEAIKRGERDRALSLLRTGSGGAVRLVPLGDAAAVPATLRPLVLAGLHDYLTSDDPGARLQALGAFRVLCAHRRGAFGVERVNATIERLLLESGRLAAEGAWYDGRPVLVTANDYQLGLFNGDVGVVARDVHGQLRAFFPGEHGSLRALPPSRLPAVETVFAMTVHKSQGSEFDRVTLVIPPQTSPLLTRELLYTGVTRARHGVTLLGTPEVVADAIGRRIERASGLRDALWR